MQLSGSLHVYMLLAVAIKYMTSGACKRMHDEGHGSVYWVYSRG